jgi:hypothetical protein
MFKGRTKRRRGPVKVRSHIFHGVSIEPGEACECSAVQAHRNVRVLSEDALPLPLDDCSDPGQCRCTYQHYDDRRTRPRRDSDMGMPVRDAPVNQRAGVGRRITDG